MKRRKSQSKFVLCIRNDDCDDLELRKVYEVVEDPTAEEEGYLRIVDESGEDYLYPGEYFGPVDLPAATAKAFARSRGKTVYRPALARHRSAQTR